MIYGNVYVEGHSNNSLFAEEDNVHRYNPTTTPRLLRQAFLERGIEINTPDVNQGRQIAFDLHIEGRQFVANDLPQYLIALENPNINKLNENIEYCQRFDKVFAWDMRLNKLPNLVPILIPHPLAYDHFPGFSERDIFSCLINANKAFKENLPSDLYLERINTIRWYERNAPDKFELYGMGWDKSTPAFNFAGRVRRSLSRARTRLFGHKPFPSYRGEVRDKAEVLRRSKYSYCYENSRDLSNYITEKILDSLVNGCVPVYWGADNVLEYIPADCFIDRRKFKDTSAVHEFLLSISAEDYAKYQLNIAKFLKSDVARKFSSEYFVSVVVEQVTRDLAAAGQA
jgi:hypothetical protein